MTEAIYILAAILSFIGLAVFTGEALLRQRSRNWVRVQSGNEARRSPQTGSARE